MRIRLLATALFSCAVPLAAAAQRVSTVPLIPEPTVAALAGELSGASAKRNLEFITRQHRMRASRGFRSAADFVAAQAKSYGLEEVVVHEFPADGHTMYGTQRARLGWDPEFAELWEVRADGSRIAPVVRVASFEDEPVILAEDSDSADVTAELVDVGAGTSDKDYAGKNVRGKIVLTSEAPGDVVPLAYDKYGAKGVVSAAQNQPNAWSREDVNAIRWGHLDSFEARHAFAFMVSLKQYRGYVQRLAAGEHVMLHAIVKASRHAATYNPVTALIPGSDRKNEEIVLSCHLDHQRPGANDNASGCATILEVARTISKLVADGKIGRPSRGIRFVWPCEVECTLALFHSEPGMLARFKAVIHMDMVGGGPVTKSIFHVGRGPLSLPSFVSDVGQRFGAFMNTESQMYAQGTGGKYPMISGEGGKEPQLGDLDEFTMGSDHELYQEASWRIPAIYMNDWPDRYIHTNFDLPANIDPTKLQRAAFIGAASALYLANFKSTDTPALWSVMESASLRRLAQMLDRRSTLSAADGAALTRTFLAEERGAFESIASFAAIPDSTKQSANAYFARLETITGTPAAPPPASGDGALVFARNTAVSGPMVVFGYDYLADHTRGKIVPKLLDFEGLRGGGGEYGYEVLNFVDGKRNVRDIRDAVSAEYGPVDIALVTEYLRALESAGVIKAAK
ncbi:MAG: M28 family peptidase [Gemmatimonadaceae bacterium]|nr:M28 family peptidase [Gemmatimonadaceae bacterium]